LLSLPWHGEISNGNPSRPLRGKTLIFPSLQ
jgi:hypothetical protein